MMKNPITVKQLKKLLDTIDDDRIIVMSSDEEGNSYSPLRQVEKGLYLEENLGRGEIYPDRVNISEGWKAIVLYP